MTHTMTPVLFVVTPEVERVGLRSIIHELEWQVERLERNPDPCSDYRLTFVRERLAERRARLDAMEGSA
jgi:hypothetical protein